jgi:plasmid stabilization system protein ParE
LKVRFTPEAESRATTVATWWRRNGIVRDLFDRELAEAQQKVIADPNLGIVYRTVRGMIIRRILLPKTQQHFYYSADEGTGIILVHMIWGARRGRGPRL